jgi:hypothetical protein
MERGRFEDRRTLNDQKFRDSGKHFVKLCG